MTKEEVVQNVNSIPEGAISGDVRSTFCSVWPTVKEGLQLLAKAVPALTFFINLVVIGGDALSKKICV